MKKNIIKISVLSFITLCIISLSGINSFALPVFPPKKPIPKDSTAVNNKGAGNKTAADTTKINPVQIDTGKVQIPVVPPVQIDTTKKMDSILTAPVTETALTNTKLFVYILLSLLGMGLFFFIFVMMMFKTFHKTRSTRQSLSLSWSLFFLVSVIWIFIIWGVVAGFSGVAAFTAVLIFLFIISLILTIISIKTR